MWLLLFALTAAVVLLPMLPAWMEWRRPSDVTPLFIDKDDALDPPYLARSFAASLAQALALRKTRLGRSPITTLAPRSAWPFDELEKAQASTLRVWHLTGKAQLPEGMHFLGEVAARRSLRAAPGGVYRALWVRHHLLLPATSTVLRWAHATRVWVGPGADLAGRVSADQLITVGAGVRFTLLHAPLLRFGPVLARPTVQHLPADERPAPGLPAAVAWHAASASGRCSGPLDLAPGSRWVGDLVCSGDLHLGAGCQVDGSLKAHGRLTLGAGCRISGAVFARGEIVVHADAVVGGPLVSETALALGERCVVGSPLRTCSVTAPRIDVAGGVTVHGTVWARDEGRCTATASTVPAARAATAQRQAEAPRAKALA